MEHYKIIHSILNQKGIGRVKANQILQQLEVIFNQEFIPSNRLVAELNNYFSVDEVNEIINRHIDYKLKESTPPPDFINRFQEYFPNSLKELKLHCPPILSCIGNKDLLKSNKIGFCGSRKASEKGIEVAKDVSQQVSANNITVVSGYASGIDQETHYWALKEGGSTIIVLPEGIKGFKIKKRIKDVWDWDRILVISEFAPNEIWSVNRAMQRNSTIIALSNIMFLIEAREKGGSMDAGYKTLQMNKPLFAPVYQGMPSEASGNQLLLNKGALPLMKKRDTNRANLDKVMEMFSTINSRKNNLFD